MFLVPLYGAQTVIAVLHLPYVPCAPVLCPNCHCCAPSTICSLCPCMVSKLSLMCSIYHMFLVPLYGVQNDIAVLHLPYVPCAPVWCPNCHCCAPSTICSLCPCMVSNLSLLCSIYHMFLVPLYGAQTVIAVLHLPYVPCAPCMVPKLSLLCSIYHMFLVPLYGAQTVIAVLHLPYVPCAPVWCPNCHCCAPSTVCSLCPCMVSKLSLMCSIYHMFLVPLYGVQTVIDVLHLPYVPCAPVWCPKLSLLCSIYHMFLVPLYGVQPVIAVLHLPYVPCAPCMVPKLSLLCSIYHMFLVPLYDVKLSLLCSIYHMFLVLLYDVKLAMPCSIYHMFLVPLVWCPNCNYCAPSTICSLCPCMVPKLSLLCSIYHMFLVPLYGAQTLIAVLRLPFVHCALVWCPNNHCCAPSAICSLSPCMVPKLS